MHIMTKMAVACIRCAGTSEQPLRSREQERIEHFTIVSALRQSTGSVWNVDSRAAEAPFTHHRANWFSSSSAASVAVGLAITETWRHYSWQMLAWAWLALPAVAAGALTRLWPRIRQAWSSYTMVRIISSRTLFVSHLRCRCTLPV